MSTRRVVVVGSGIAGLTAALHAATAGCRVTVVTKDRLAEANTRYAQGGIAAVMFADDSVEAHARDTLIAGAGLGDPEAVRVLAAEGPARVRELVADGVAFDRDADGGWVKGLEAAHSYPRVLHAGGDATGAAIEEALVSRVRRTGIEVVEHAFLLDILTASTGEVTGVAVLVDGTRQAVDADAVILATGGAGQLYAHTTNPAVATGDGIAAALRVGAAVADLEFVQFHPTVLPADDRHGAFLVSEAVRGEGAVLRDANGQRFLPHVHPDAELAPRDVVARAIAEVMARQGGAPVVLDATALRPTAAQTAEFLAARFPTIDAAVRARGADWAREPIAVTPAAHYLMGGVVTDLVGRTSVPGLYAVGEAARTGVHGANRLASNSLLEGAVFGARAGDAVAHDDLATWPVERRPIERRAVDAPADGAVDAPIAAPVSSTDDDAALIEAAPGRAGTTAPTGATPFARAALQRLMWDHVGLVRDERGLAHAAQVLAVWQNAAHAAHAPTAARPDVSALEDANLLQIAQATVAAARARTGSVGAHMRSDDTGIRSSDPENATGAAAHAASSPTRPAWKVPA